MDEGITVTGVGRVAVTPDQVQARLRLQCTGTDVAEAVSALTTRTDALLAVIRERGVRREDVLTAGLHVEPHWSDRGGGQRDGFVATHAITVSLAEGSAFGELLAALVDVAGNDLGLDSVEQQVADATEQWGQARQAAFTDACERAQQFAQLAGRRLGPVASVHERSSGPADDSPRIALASLNRGLDVQSGSATITAAVTVFWHWE